MCQTYLSLAVTLTRSIAGKAHTDASRLLVLAALVLQAWSAPLAAQAADEVAPSDAAHCERKVIKRVYPAYPAELVHVGNNGEVTVSARVAADGSVHDPELLASSHPAFERVAIAAMSGGESCDAVIEHFDFHLQQHNQAHASLSDVEKYEMPFGLTAMSSEDLGKLPEEFRYDTPPQMKTAVPVVYPYEQLVQGESGEARAAFYVGPDGRVKKTQLISATQEAFGQALLASLSAWTFEPATKGGAPSWALIEYSRIFSPNERDFAYDFERPAFLREVARGGSAVPTLVVLDHPPKALYHPMPVVEPAYEHAGETGRIEFIIDKRGLVRYPHASDFKDQRLAWAAIVAVSRWQFEPPMKGGEAIDVRAIMPVKFPPSAGQ